MLVHTYAPCAELQSLVKYYYVSESMYPDFVTDVFFADGCVEVVFHVGLDFYRGNEKEASAKVIGQILEPLTMKAQGQGTTFGIWFYPHAFSLFCGVALYEFTDKAIALDSLFDAAFIDVVQNYVFENQLDKLLAVTNHYLTSRFHQRTQSRKESLLTYSVKYIQEEKGAANLDSLTTQCRISYRYLQQIFMDHVGVSPKQLIRIMRFQHALQQLTHQQPGSQQAGLEPTTNLTELTYQTGYYDQAHFIREFKSFTGLTPSQFRFSHRPINQYFLHL